MPDERAATPGGLPYPLPTDPVTEGAAAIRALAEAVEAVPAVDAYYAGGNQGPVLPGVNFPATFSATRADTAAMWAAANPTRLTIKKNGIYLIGGNIEWTASGAGTFRQLSVLLNAANTVLGQIINPVVGPGYARQQLSVLRRLVVGDYVQLVGLHDVPSPGLTMVTNAYSPTFWAVRVAT